MYWTTVLLLISTSLQARGQSQFDPVFDGRVRKTHDGRYEAYLIPPAAANHASFLEHLPSSGDLVLTWFSGTAEGANNCSIVLSRLSNGGIQWSRASLVSRRSGYSNQNPVLFYDIDRKVLYLYHSQQPAEGETGIGSAEKWSNIWRLESGDGGLTWSPPVDVFTKNGSFDRNRIILSLTDSWIFPIYYSEEGIENQFSTVMISTDHKEWASHYIPHSNYLVQPSVIRPHPSKPFLLAFLRDRRAQHLYSTNSSDDGLSWTDPVVTGLPNNDAAIQACVLSNGNIVLVYNPTTGPRVPLRVSLSEDGGKTWSYSRDLETSGTEFSYPSVLQTAADGYIHVSYTYNRQTIKYVKFLENWIKNNSVL